MKGLVLLSFSGVPRPCAPRGVHWKCMSGCGPSQTFFRPALTASVSVMWPPWAGKFRGRHAWLRRGIARAHFTGAVSAGRLPFNPGSGPSCQPPSGQPNASHTEPSLGPQLLADKYHGPSPSPCWQDLDLAKFGTGLQVFQGRVLTPHQIFGDSPPTSDTSPASAGNAQSFPKGWYIFGVMHT